MQSIHGLLALTVLSLMVPPTLAGPMPTVPVDPTGPTAASRADARKVAGRIDDYIQAGYRTAGVTPAPHCDDTAFLRRASLDLNGRIPAVNDIRKFLIEKASDKREQAIERMLDNPGYVNHFTTIWIHHLLPETTADIQKRYVLPPLHSWLRGHLSNNTTYDKIVRELVALELKPRGDDMRYRRVVFDGAMTQASPMPFYLIKQGKPEELAASVSRLFLGVRLECAQCHDHPFGKWKREEFWSQAAFFGGVSGQGAGFGGQVFEAGDRRELAIPNTERVAQARFLDGSMPRWKFKVGARQTLAEWMTARNNPFFAKALANRMWAHFFGIGLVEPVDDLVEDNAASHPELLDYLAGEFASHDFDLKFLIRAITQSKTYQLSSVVETKEQPDARLFARMLVKGLTAEQIYESLRQATGIRDNTAAMIRIFNYGTPRQQFEDKFTEQEKKTEYQTSIPQALTMMNNQLITEATHPDRGEVLGAVLSLPFITNANRIETLYLSALSRKPRPDEAEKMLAYVERGGAAKNERKALADVFWALLNSTEFKFNH